MQHKTLEQLQQIAAIYPDDTRPAMTRGQRLERWAKLLESEPGRRLGTLPGTEYQSEDIRATMRGAGSPLAVAFADPVLRAEGLSGDGYGEAKRFFELSDWQLHNIVCYCHHGVTMTAGTAARHVRAAIKAKPGMFSLLREILVR